MRDDWLSLAWKVLVARGVVGIVFGVVALVWPGETAVAFVVLWGIWALVDGIGSIVEGFSSDPPGPRWIHLLMGAASLVVAFFAIFSPSMTATTLTWILGIWLIVRGVSAFASAFLGRADGSRGMLVAIGAIDLVLGVLFVANPGRAAVGITVVFGLVAMLWGVVFLAIGLVVRRNNATSSGMLRSLQRGEAVTVTQPGETPRMLEALPALPEADVVVDVALGIVGGSIGVGLAVLRRVPGRRVLRSRAVWRPAFLPTGLQPATLVTELARRGAWQRARTAEQVGALLDQWTPALVEMVVSRLDLTNLVIRHLDVEGIVASVDLDAPSWSRAGPRGPRPPSHHQGLVGLLGIGDGPRRPHDRDQRRRGHRPSDPASPLPTTRDTTSEQLTDGQGRAVGRSVGSAQLPGQRGRDRHPVRGERHRRSGRPGVAPGGVRRLHRRCGWSSRRAASRRRTPLSPGR